MATPTLPIPPVDRPNWSQTTMAIIALIGLTLTIIGTSSATLARIELLRADIETVKQQTADSAARQQKQLDDHESRLRAIERALRP